MKSFFLITFLTLFLANAAVAQSTAAGEGDAIPPWLNVVACDNGSGVSPIQCDSTGRLMAGGGVVSLTSEITVSAVAYAAGDYINDADTITELEGAADVSGGAFIITDVVVQDEGAEGKNLEAWFFRSDPTASTFTDNAVFDVADADLRHVACVVPIVRHYSANDNGVSVAEASCVVDLVSGTSLYMALVAREAVTFDATDAIAAIVTVERK